MIRYTDKEIVKQLKERKSEAVKYIFKEFLPIIKNMANNTKINRDDVFVMGNDKDAEDVFQEALIVIIKKIDKGDLDLRVKFSTFLYAVCKNILRSKLQKRIIAKAYKLTQSIVLEEEVNISENYDSEVQKKAFDHYFSTLNESCQKILKLYWLEISVKEISKITGFTEKYIRKRKYVCKNKLVELIMTNPDKF